MRPALIFLLSVGLLACPVRCASGVGCADALSPSVGASTCCGGCLDDDHGDDDLQRSDDLHGDMVRSCSQLAEECRSPICPCDGCDCVACVCQGAMIQADASAGELLKAVTATLPVDWLATRGQVRPLDFAPANRDAVILPLVSGRAARIALQSFQI